MFLLRIKKQLKMTNVQNMSLLLILRFSISLLKNELINWKNIWRDGGGGYIWRKTRHMSYHMLLLHSSYTALTLATLPLFTNYQQILLLLRSYSAPILRLITKLSKNILLLHTSHIYFALIYLFCFNYKNFKKHFSCTSLIYSDLIYLYCFN